MNTKSLPCLVCFLAVAFTEPIANAGPHREGGNHVRSMPARAGGARVFVGGNRFNGGNGFAGWNGQRWSGQRFVGNHWNHWGNNWNWHHHRNVVFFDVGFPFWGWWGYPYSYGYYPYGYPYGYYGGGYYGSGYYGNSGYGYNNGYSNGNGNSSSVIELQRKLADAGYYHGPIDGIMGSRTQHALRAYQYDRRNGNTGGSSPTLRSRPYSPPPITTEPQEPTE
jgi:Putative peptidoglycan binding domain